MLSYVKLYYDYKVCLKNYKVKKIYFLQLFWFLVFFPSRLLLPYMKTLVLVLPWAEWLIMFDMQAELQMHEVKNVMVHSLSVCRAFPNITGFLLK